MKIDKEIWMRRDMKISIRFFNDKEVRAAWNEDNNNGILAYSILSGQSGKKIATKNVVTIGNT